MPLSTFYTTDSTKLAAYFYIHKVWVAQSVSRARNPDSVFTSHEDS